MAWKRRAMVSLGLGVLTTIGVAWYPQIEKLIRKPTLSLTRGRPGYSMREARMSSYLHDPPLASFYWRIRRSDGPGGVEIRLEGPQILSMQYSREDGSTDESLFRELGAELGDLPAEVRLARGEPDPHPRGVLVNAPIAKTPGDAQRGLFEWFAFGRPWLALSYDNGWKPRPYVNGQFGQQPYAWGWTVIPKGQMSGLGIPRREAVFPLRPVWPGFAMDTALFGAAWFGIIFAGARTRRAIFRVRTGCQRCGYDRAGLTPSAPCPECGTSPVPPPPNHPNPNEPSAQAEGAPGATNPPAT